MREPKRDRERLEHILEAIGFVKKYTAGYDCDSLAGDSLHYHATVHNIQVIGEAVYKLSSEFKDCHLQTKWDVIEKTRHILVHDYYRINAKALWVIIVDDLPELERQVREYISEFQ